jgi:hypothetical protein
MKTVKEVKDTETVVIFTFFTPFTSDRVPYL